MTKGPSFGCRCFRFDVMSNEVAGQFEELLQELDFTAIHCFEHLSEITLEDEGVSEDWEDECALKVCQTVMASRKCFKSLVEP